MIGLAGPAMAILLMQGPRRATTPRQATAVPQGANTDAVATFTGTFKSADKKFVIVEVDGGQTVRMYLTRSTKFFRDGKPARASDFESGEKITADASQDGRMNFLAVRIDLAKSARSASTQPGSR